LTYALLGQLYLEGVTAVTLPTIQIIPSLAQTVKAPFSADESAAGHQTLLGFNVFPYESIFLDGSGLLGGAVTETVQHSYREAGFEVDAGSSSPDHIGHELALLAHLCGAEADAWQDNLAFKAEQMRQLQWDFLQEHLLRWLVPFVLAVKGQKRPFYTALAELTLEFILDHVSGIGIPDTQLKDNFGNWNSRNMQLSDLLANEKTSLKNIAEFLTTPLHSGIYLGRDDITRLARQQDLPRGFGDRAQMLANLMRSAVQYDGLPALLAELANIAERWGDEYGRFAATMPAITPFITPWHDRINNTRQALAQIQRQITALL
jgi:TorA maturation chaperone TorD